MHISIVIKYYKLAIVFMTIIQYNISEKGGIIMNSKINRIGENIKALREQSGFTQSNIARFLKVDQSLISKIENNERFITSDMLEKLSALFGVTADSLLGESVPTNRILFALRASEINENDLEILCAINRIALNLNFVTQLLGGHTNDR
jgi:transcriptional regulator with XRE-family HTH domain